MHPNSTPSVALCSHPAQRVAIARVWVAFARTLGEAWASETSIDVDTFAEIAGELGLEGAMRHVRAHGNSIERSAISSMGSEVNVASIIRDHSSVDVTLTFEIWKRAAQGMQKTLSIYLSAIKDQPEIAVGVVGERHYLNDAALEAVLKIAAGLAGVVPAYRLANLVGMAGEHTR